MRILLVNPYCLDQRIQDYDIRVPPIGLYYIAACLIEAGHECSILNLWNKQGQQQLVKSEIRRFNPDLVGVSILHATRWGGIDIARITKAVFPEVPVVFGGPGATFLWHHLLTHFPELDYIVLGEGELTILRLAELLQHDRKTEIPALPGLAFRQGGKPEKNDPPDFIKDLDSLPDPSRYFKFQHIISSRGCPWNCAFCGSPRIWKRKVRFHSPSYFVDQIENLYRAGTSFFYISDDTFTLKKERVIQICKLILERKLDISWAAISRVNNIDEDILYWMRRAGCTQISYGVESGSPKIRKALNKNLKNSQIHQAFEITASHGIMPRAYIIYGSPGETRKTITETIRLMERIRPLSAIFYILDIFPGTALYDIFKKNTGVNDDIWLKRIEDIMYFQTDPSLSQDTVLEFGKRLRKAFYRNLPKFADSIKLVKHQELYPLHADFLSRLAMTFAFGDYSRIKDIPASDAVAERLFNRSLQYVPDHRAFLGLGMLLQRRGKHRDAIEILKKGLKHFPESPDLQVCLGVSLMNTGRLEQALELFIKNPSNSQAGKYAEYCRQLIRNSRTSQNTPGKFPQNILHKR